MELTLAQIWSDIPTSTLKATRVEWTEAIADGRAGDDKAFFAQHVSDLTAEIERRADR